MLSLLGSALYTAGSYVGSTLGFLGSAIPAVQLGSQVCHQFMSSDQFAAEMEFKKLQFRRQSSMQQITARREAATQLFQLAYQQIKGGNTEDAINCFEDGLADYAAAQEQFSHASVELTRYDSRQLSNIQFMLALLYFSKIRTDDDSNLQRAEELVKQSLALAANSEKWLLLCHIYLLCGRGDDARNALAKALTANPDSEILLLTKAALDQDKRSVEEYITLLLTNSINMPASANYFFPLCFTMAAAVFSENRDYPTAKSLLYQAVEFAKKVNMSRGILSGLLFMQANLFFLRAHNTLGSTLTPLQLQEEMSAFRESLIGIKARAPTFHILQTSLPSQSQSGQNETVNEHASASSTVDKQLAMTTNNLKGGCFIELPLEDLDKRFIAQTRVSPNELAVSLKYNKTIQQTRILQAYIITLIKQSYFWEAQNVSPSRSIRAIFREKIEPFLGTEQYDEKLAEFSARDDVIAYFIDVHLLNRGWQAWFYVYCQSNGSLVSLLDIFCQANGLSKSIYMYVNDQLTLLDGDDSNGHTKPFNVLYQPGQRMFTPLLNVVTSRDVYLHLSIEGLLACKQLVGSLPPTGERLFAILGNPDARLKMAEEERWDPAQRRLADSWLVKAVRTRTAEAEFQYGLHLICGSAEDNAFQHGLFYLSKAALQQYPAAVYALRLAIKLELAGSQGVNLATLPEITTEQLFSIREKFRGRLEEETWLATLFHQQRYFQVLCIIMLAKQTMPTSALNIQALPDNPRIPADEDQDRGRSNTTRTLSRTTTDNHYARLFAAVMQSQALLALSLYQAAEEHCDQAIKEWQRYANDFTQASQVLYFCLWRDKTFLLLCKGKEAEAYELLTDLVAAKHVCRQAKKVIYPLLAYLHISYGHTVDKTIERYQRVTSSPHWYVGNIQAMLPERNVVGCLVYAAANQTKALTGTVISSSWGLIQKQLADGDNTPTTPQRKKPGNKLAEVSLEAQPHSFVLLRALKPRNVSSLTADLQEISARYADEISYESSSDEETLEASHAAISHSY